MTKTPKKNLGGRPPIVFNWERLDSLCQRNMMLSDCSEIMQISEATIKRKINSKHNLSFELYRNKKMAVTRLRLINSALDKAELNTTMHIFCLKNLCNWGDRTEVINENRLSKDFVIEKRNGDKEILKVES